MNGGLPGTCVDVGVLSCWCRDLYFRGCRMLRIVVVTAKCLDNVINISTGNTVFVSKYIKCRHDLSTSDSFSLHHELNARIWRCGVGASKVAGTCSELWNDKLVDIVPIGFPRNCRNHIATIDFIIVRIKEATGSAGNAVEFHGTCIGRR